MNGSEHHTLMRNAVPVPYCKIAVCQRGGAVIQRDHGGISARCDLLQGIEIAALIERGGVDQLDRVFPCLTGGIVGRTECKPGSAVACQRDAAFQGQKTGPYAVGIEYLRFAPRFSAV